MPIFTQEPKQYLNQLVPLLQSVPRLKQLTFARHRYITNIHSEEMYGDGLVRVIDYAESNPFTGVWATFTRLDGEPYQVCLDNYFKSTSTRYSAEANIENSAVIDATFVENVLSHNLRDTFTNEELWEPIVATLRAVATVLHRVFMDFADAVPLPTVDEPAVIIGAMVGHDATAMVDNQLIISLASTLYPHDYDITVTNSGFTAAERMFYRFREAHKLFQEPISNEFLSPMNLTMPLDCFYRPFIMDLTKYTEKHQSSPMHVPAYDIAPLSPPSLAATNSVARALQEVYVDVQEAQALLGSMFKCPIMNRYYFTDPHRNSPAFHEAYNFDQRYRNYAVVHNPPQLSLQAMYQIANEVIDYECPDCGSFTHTSYTTFQDAVYERYGSVLGDPEVRDNIRLYTHSYDFARHNLDHNDPDYYCDSCGRGEDPDSFDDDDNGEYRSEPLTDRQVATLTALAQEYKKDLKHRYDLPYFVDKGTSFEYKHAEVGDFELNSYTYTPDIRFIEGDDMDKTKLYMGLEWEVDEGGEQNAKAVAICSALTGNKDYAYTMTDGSLNNGIEIATMPATLDAHLNTFNWDMACAVAGAVGYRAHDTRSAGIHIHINRNFFSDDKKLQLYRGSLMALVMERNWDSFVKFSRRRYDRLDQWAKKKRLVENLPESFATSSTEIMINKFRDQYDGDKYVALNMQHRNTFELRIFRSSLKPDTIKATLQFVYNLAYWCKHNGLIKAQTVTMQDIIDYKPHPELTEYWNTVKDREVR